MKPSQRNKFILGLGHQKCGTSWLHSYLNQSEHFANGFAKEFHVWDSLDIPLVKIVRPKFSLSTFLNQKKRMRYKMVNHPNYYFDYFNNLMKKNKFMTADISPSYCGLKAERLQFIKREFLERGIDVKVVILVREPLSRIKSAVRFNLDRKNYSEGIKPFENNFISALEQYYKTEHCLLRTTYKNIIVETSKTFKSEDIHIGLYENMFEENEVLRLSEFLQIQPNFEIAKVHVNKTKGVVSDTPLDTEIKDYYTDTYEFMKSEFPIVTSLWT